MEKIECVAIVPLNNEQKGLSRHNNTHIDNQVVENFLQKDISCIVL